MGRIDHALVGEQQGATASRVEAAKARHPLVRAEMEAGDCIFFHALTLHASKPNTSDVSRWALTCCYNTAANDPIEESFHPNYSKLETMDDSAVLECGAVAQWTEASDLLGADVSKAQAEWGN